MFGYSVLRGCAYVMPHTS